MYLYKQDSKYVGSYICQNFEMGKLWIRQGSRYASVTQRSEYARICLGRVLNIP